MFGKYTIVSLDRAEKISTLTEKKNDERESYCHYKTNLQNVFIFNW